jgi:putative peptidoglycan lipid II flippase
MAHLLRTRSPLLRSANRPRLLAAAGLLILFGGLGAIVGTSRGTVKRHLHAPTATAQAPAIHPTPVRRHSRPALVRVPVTAVGAYDPEGDGSENDGDARLATDGNPASAWKSEHYRSAFSKSGVGLVVDAGRPVIAKRVIVATETPGFQVQVRVGESAKGPFTAVSTSKVTSPTTTLALRSRKTRYLMLWITSMPQTGVAAVNEITVAAGD